jgi:hypothetical protein
MPGETPGASALRLATPGSRVLQCTVDRPAPAATALEQVDRELVAALAVDLDDRELARASST